MSYLTASTWMLSFPLDLGSVAAVLGPLRSAIAEAGGEESASLVEFAVPNLKVGAIDVFMALSDDAARADSFVEGVVRKVERQVLESWAASTTTAGASGAPQFSVNGVSPADYLKRWTWDSDQFDTRDPLPELLRRLMGNAEKIDAEVRATGTAYSEKRQILTGMERKAAGNFMITNLEDVLTPEACRAADVEFQSPDNEYLASYVFIIPKMSEPDFLATYESLAPEALPIGPIGNRDSAHCSPVVPGSARRVAEDKEGYVLYVVTAMKKCEDALRAAAREKRFTLRDFVYDPIAAGSGAKAISALGVEVSSMLAHLREQSVRKYGEAFLLWMHVKAVRVFVESILRYGLPSDMTPGRSGFAIVLLFIKRGAQRKALKAVRAAWAAINTSPARALLEEAYAGNEKGGADPVIPGVSDAAGGAASFPFVMLDFEIRKEAAAAGAR